MSATNVPVPSRDAKNFKKKLSPAVKPKVDLGTCTYSFFDVTEGEIHKCNAKAKCTVCNQCSAIENGKEIGHCTGHLGLHPSIPTRA